MSTQRERIERKYGYRDGVRASINWLHSKACTMNDVRARALLNLAADELGKALRNEAVEDVAPAGADDIGSNGRE